MLQMGIQPEGERKNDMGRPINPSTLARDSFFSGSSNLINDLSLGFAQGVPSRALISTIKGMTRGFYLSLFCLQI